MSTASAKKCREQKESRKSLKIIPESSKKNVLLFFIELHFFIARFLVKEVEVASRKYRGSRTIIHSLLFVHFWCRKVVRNEMNE